MSIFAGVMCTDDVWDMPEDFIVKIRANITRRKMKIFEYRKQNLYIAHIQVGAFHDNGCVENDGGFAVLAGEPVLDRNASAVPSRLLDLMDICHALGNGETGILKETRGTFCLLCYIEQTRSLWLIADKAGTRPLYYCIHGNLIWFSSALRTLERISVVPKRLNESAIVQKIVFGVPLGSETPYKNIHVLQNGEFLKVEKGVVSVNRYFLWKDIQPFHGSLGELREESFRLFADAVVCRARGEVVASLLSGGLDSRCVVSMLRKLGKRVVTFNFSRPGEQDAEYGRQFASRVGAEYLSVARPVIGWSWGELLAKVPNLAERHAHRSIDYPQLVFSGDGGSVGVGRVYMEDSMNHLMRENRVSEAIAYFCKQRGLPRKLMKPGAYERVMSQAMAKMKDEIIAAPTDDRARSFFLFLLQNDQRRHLHEFYEDMDLNCVEILLPFFDGRFLELMVSAPIDSLMYHQFYHEWLKLFGSDTYSVPWQTYPGHLECPLIIKNRSHPRYQWEGRWSDELMRSLVQGFNAARYMLSNDFPHEIFYFGRGSAAILTNMLFMPRYRYVIKAIHEFGRYLSRCEKVENGS